MGVFGRIRQGFERARSGVANAAENLADAVVGGLTSRYNKVALGAAGLVAGGVLGAGVDAQAREMDDSQDEAVCEYHESTLSEVSGSLDELMSTVDRAESMQDSKVSAEEICDGVTPKDGFDDDKYFELTSPMSYMTAADRVEVPDSFTDMFESTDEEAFSDDLGSDESGDVEAGSVVTRQDIEEYTFGGVLVPIRTISGENGLVGFGGDVPNYVPVPNVGVSIYDSVGEQVFHDLSGPVGVMFRADNLPSCDEVGLGERCSDLYELDSLQDGNHEEIFTVVVSTADGELGGIGWDGDSFLVDSDLLISPTQYAELGCVDVEDECYVMPENNSGLLMVTATPLPVVDPEADDLDADAGAFADAGGYDVNNGVDGVEFENLPRESSACQVAPTGSPRDLQVFFALGLLAAISNRRQWNLLKGV